MSLGGFTAPWWFLLLVAVAVLVAGYLWVQRRKRRQVLRFTNLALLERVMPRGQGWPRHVPAALLGVALITMVVGLAGPTADAKVPRNRATVLLVVDVSLSMQATDVQPSRLATAQQAASQFARQLPHGVNLGLESFSATPTVLVPPTTERAPVIQQISTLKLGPATGTGDALETALDTLQSFNRLVPSPNGGPPPARIVLMSDGKQTVGRDEFAVARTAAADRIPISTISFGTPNGSVNLDGEDVPVPVDDASLSEVAKLSGGEFFAARSGADLHQVYDTLGQQIGYQTLHTDASKPWFALGTVALIVAVGAGLVVSQRVPA
jgi:Ca-activated chloride channel family protein